MSLSDAIVVLMVVTVVACEYCKRTFHDEKIKAHCCTRQRGRVVSSPPATKETGAMGHEIESRQGIYMVVAFKSEKIK
jgi:hypothetical protein